MRHLTKSPRAVRARSRAEVDVGQPDPGAFRLPDAGGVISYSTCAAGVATGFVETPTAAPDAACAQGLKPVWVLPPAADAAGTPDAVPGP